MASFCHICSGSYCGLSELENIAASVIYIYQIVTLYMRSFMILSCEYMVRLAVSDTFQLAAIWGLELG